VSLGWFKDAEEIDALLAANCTDPLAARALINAGLTVGAIGDSITDLEKYGGSDSIGARVSENRMSVGDAVATIRRMRRHGGNNR
jgi:hypothetical protein